MGKAIDTVAAFVTEAAAAAFPVALAAAPGDNLSIRSYNIAKKAWIQAMIYSAGGGQPGRIVSPMLHDNVTGLTWVSAEAPALMSLPPEKGVKLVTNDTLSLYGGIAAAGTIVMGLVNYYEDLDGQEARLFNWDDISGNIKTLKMVQVQLGAIAVGVWTDTLITATEQQLHADSYYAILGYNTNPAVDIVAFKGSDTGNLRAGGPGVTSSIDTTDYFLWLSQRSGRPCIPVFNSNNRFSFYVSGFNHAAIAAQAATVSVMLAELEKRP